MGGQLYGLASAVALLSLPEGAGGVLEGAGAREVNHRTPLDAAAASLAAAGPIPRHQAQRKTRPRARTETQGRGDLQPVAPAFSSRCERSQGWSSECPGTRAGGERHGVERRGRGAGSRLLARSVGAAKHRAGHAERVAHERVAGRWVDLGRCYEHGSRHSRDRPAASGGWDRHHLARECGLREHEESESACSGHSCPCSCGDAAGRRARSRRRRAASATPIDPCSAR